MIAPPTPPSHDELEALIKEARARQLRRRLLGAAGVAVAAALGLGIYAFVAGGSPANVAQPPASGGRATGPTCRATQLSTTVGFQGATQTDVGGAEIKNVGDGTCSLPGGWPRVRLSSNGHTLSVQQRRPLRSGAPPEPAARVLAPGQRAVVEMQWLNWCGSPHQPVRNGGEPLRALDVSFALRFGARLVVTAESTGTPPCLAPSRPSALVVDRARADH
ncbi:MAG TPA: DUF4232 domain-containing protein [Gaiellaceae bacterium]|nr:DUF4232 domain-containing protein [Gaiellaceae bacterium]